MTSFMNPTDTQVQASHTLSSHRKGGGHIITDAGTRPFVSTAIRIPRVSRWERWEETAHREPQEQPHTSFGIGGCWHGAGDAMRC